MIVQKEKEEIIKLLYDGFSIKEISFELDIPIEEVKTYNEQLNFRKLINQCIEEENIREAIDKLEDFIKNTDYNIVEQVMLLKLKAYIEGIDIPEEDLKKNKKVNLENIEQILKELDIKLPIHESSRLINQKNEEEIAKNYDKVINKLKQKIDTDSKNGINLNERNILAFAYFKAGRIDEARKELVSIIKKYGSHIAYRQLIHLEEQCNNLDDARLWAYEGITYFPKSIQIREQLLSIEKQEGNKEEQMRLLKEIIDINKQNIEVEK